VFQVKIVFLRCVTLISVPTLSIAQPRNPLSGSQQWLFCRAGWPGFSYRRVLMLRHIPGRHTNYPDIDENREVGSINVFNLKQNYNEPFVLKKAGGVQRKCEALFRSGNSLKYFKKRMKVKRMDINAYEKFYIDQFGTEFLPKKFHIYDYSKLVRDIHDNVLERDRSTNNDDIKKLVRDHPA
jgi:hypothetical protein